MECYLVGGAVRDVLLGRPVRERDWVLTGARPKDLLDLGFLVVGKDFPVFLAPGTGEEYALARRERKAGTGHKGFQCDFGPEITLEEDLVRRDLTINAMARPALFRNGRAEVSSDKIIDPHGGLADLRDRVLRHVSPAFSEDPLRVLRVARFAAQLMPWGFRIAPETEKLLAGMVAGGEVDDLTPERIWRELNLALASGDPNRFFETLIHCDALQRLLPELGTEALHDWSSSWGAEGLRAALTGSTPIGPKEAFALILTGAMIPRPLPLVRHHQIRPPAALGHPDPPGFDQQRLQQVETLLDSVRDRLRVPNAPMTLARDTVHCLALAMHPEPNVEFIHRLFGRLDLFRNPARFHAALAIVERLQRSAHQHWPLVHIRRMVGELQKIDVDKLRRSGFKGRDLGAKIQKTQLEIIAGWLSYWQYHQRTDEFKDRVQKIRKGQDH